MDNTFLNPYNFIAFPDKKASAYSDTDRHSGVIEYTITTRSPLFIPNTSSDNAFHSTVSEHGTFDFYSYNELDKEKDYSDVYFQPVIPGSELRGMIRNIYETLTDSCMGVLNEATRPVMRVGQIYNAGLIERSEDGKYVLVEAEDCIYRKNNPHSKSFKDQYLRLYSLESVKEGTKVFFSKIVRKAGKPLITEIRTKRDMEHPDCGYLIKGMADGSIRRKHNCHVFIPVENSKRINLSSKDIEGLRMVISAYQEEPGAKSSYEEYQKSLEKYLKGEGEKYFPVYYSQLFEKQQEGGYIYLAPACMTKEVARKTLGDLADDFAPCKKALNKCPACDLFGMTGMDNTEAGVSKIRVTDAIAEDKESVQDYYDAIVTLETLSYPRVMNTEFYLKRPTGADFWNYDYLVRNKMVEKYDATLRGRKFYWHQRDKKLRKDIEATKLNKSVRPVKSGVVFSGRLFFDGISEKQLSQMIWILNGGNNEEMPITGPIAYKLGMGKPLGLGSVELKVTKVKERVIDIVDEKIVYSVSEEVPEIPTYSEVAFSESVKNDFFTISSLDATKDKLVTYPITSRQKDKPMTEGFEWFIANHTKREKYLEGKTQMVTSQKNMLRVYELPPIKGVRTLPMDVHARQQVRNNSDNREGLKWGDTIVCELLEDPVPNFNGDTTNSSYVARIKTHNGKGRVFNIPKECQEGDEILMCITNVEKNLGNFVEKR